MNGSAFALAVLEDAELELAQLRAEVMMLRKERDACGSAVLRLCADFRGFAGPELAAHLDHVADTTRRILDSRMPVCP